MKTRIDELLVAMMEHEEKDVPRIQHFIKVYEFARLIGKLEELDAEILETLEAAAIVHDIGIHPAEKKYGSCEGTYQEMEGPAVAKKLLESLEWPKPIVERVAYLIGHHHTYTEIDGIDYQILVEADFLVNLFEGRSDKKTQANVYERIFKTEGGKRLFRSMFGE